MKPETEKRCAHQGCLQLVRLVVRYHGIDLAYGCVSAHLIPLIYATAHLGPERAIKPVGAVESG